MTFKMSTLLLDTRVSRGPYLSCRRYFLPTCTGQTPKTGTAPGPVGETPKKGEKENQSIAAEDPSIADWPRWVGWKERERERERKLHLFQPPRAD